MIFSCRSRVAFLLSSPGSMVCDFKVTILEIDVGLIWNIDDQECQHRSTNADIAIIDKGDRAELVVELI